jgi:hypothetical protein
MCDRGNSWERETVKSKSWGDRARKRLSEEGGF